MNQTARFGLPFLAPGQMQKELFHNEALLTVDMLLCPLVEGAPLPSAPVNATVGSSYLVGVDAEGEWVDQDGALACLTQGGWRFVTPREGMTVLDRASGQSLNYRGGTWESGIVRAQEVRIGGVTIIRHRQPAVGNPTGGAVVDSECRAALSQILAAMRAHGLID